MIWILLLYVLPLVLVLVLTYFVAKRDGGTMKDLLHVFGIALIPLVNIILLLAGAFFQVSNWIENDESVQNFLNKKL